MKKFFSFILVILTTITLLSVVGCTQTETFVIKESDTYIVINASNEQMQINNDTTLIDYMLSLKEDGELSFEIKNGMICSINGIENPSNYSSCWMLYTSDTDNANTTWGNVEYKGEVYGSSITGAEILKIKSGCIYIWVFQSFN